ncbi:MAG: 2Fe-2S iron-sulfur cluster-binding protein, partial [Rhodospirillales bacterium]
MTQTHRLTDGGRIDRDRPIDFFFNGRRYSGYEGDTLASALLANGVMLVGRSFKYHRPRGITSAGTEEQNALVQLERGARTISNMLATRVPLYEGLDAASVNCWPSPNFDFMAMNSLFHRILPAGFYYKTFMWPVSAWKYYEHIIRRAAGLGRSPMEPDADTYDKMNAHADLIVVGGGPAGLTAVRSAGIRGARVILVDEQTELGGQLLNERFDINGYPATNWVADIEAELMAMPNVTILKHTTAFGYYDHGFIGFLQNRSNNVAFGEDGRSRQRMWRVRAKNVLLATGSLERPLIYSDNDRPGCMLAGAVRTYVNRYGVTPGNRHVIFTNNDDAYRSALDVKVAGGDVACVVDLRTKPKGELVTQAIEAGIDVIEGSVITAVIGGKRVRAVEVMKLNEDGTGVTGSAQTITCDIVGSSGG